MRIRHLLASLIIIGYLNSNSQEYQFPFKNPDLLLEQRIDDLISRMTLEEKTSQLLYNSPAIDRISIPEYNWWNECLHGVSRVFRGGGFSMQVRVE